jgi:hypothetical protein
MADPRTLTIALDSLRHSGVSRVAVVRMFLSGRSFIDQTNYLLGLTDDRPESFILMGPAGADDGDPLPIEHGMTIATHGDGLMSSQHAAQIVAERAFELSSTPERESVLLVAHGMGDDGENAEVISAMRAAAQPLAGTGFARVDVVTLREDWDHARGAAEESMRHFVESESAARRNVIVVPFRLFGFGPYAAVLRDLEYRAGEGLLPHDAIAEWVLETASQVACSAGWGPSLGSCEVVTTPSPTNR